MLPKNHNFKSWCSWFLPKSEAGHVLKMFLNFQRISGWCCYKLGSYKKKSVVEPLVFSSFAEQMTPDKWHPTKQREDPLIFSMGYHSFLMAQVIRTQNSPSSNPFMSSGGTSSLMALTRSSSLRFASFSKSSWALRRIKTCRGKGEFGHWWFGPLKLLTEWCNDLTDFKVRYVGVKCVRDCEYRFCIEIEKCQSFA